MYSQSPLLPKEETKVRRYAVAGQGSCIGLRRKDSCSSLHSNRQSEWTVLLAEKNHWVGILWCVFVYVNIWWCENVCVCV